MGYSTFGRDFKYRQASFSDWPWSLIEPVFRFKTIPDALNTNSTNTCISYAKLAYNTSCVSMPYIRHVYNAQDKYAVMLMHIIDIRYQPRENLVRYEIAYVQVASENSIDMVHTMLNRLNSLMHFVSKRRS